MEEIKIKIYYFDNFIDESAYFFKRGVFINLILARGWECIAKYQFQDKVSRSCELMLSSLVNCLFTNCLNILIFCPEATSVHSLNQNSSRTIIITFIKRIAFVTYNACVSPTSVWCFFFVLRVYIYDRISLIFGKKKFIIERLDYFF